MSDIDEDPIVFPQKPTTDGMLELLVAAVNGTKTQMSVTLSIPGGIITGLMISYGEWLRLVDERILRDSPNATGMLDMWIEQEAETRDDESHTLPNFVHLTGAGYVEWSGMSPNPDTDGLLWRGRLSEISGWSLGSFKNFSTEPSHAD